jgi:peptide/nickel transport system substrate-binding protein
MRTCAAPAKPTVEEIMSRKPQMKRRDVLKSAGAGFVLAAAPGIVSLGLPKRARAAAMGRPWVIGMAAEAASLTNSAGNTGLTRIFVERALLTYDNKGSSFKVVPGTAVELPQVLDNGLRYRFKLRNNVYYHDGSKMDAASIVNYVMMQIDPRHPQNKLYNFNATSGRLSSIDRAVAVDDLTVDFYLKRLNAAQLDWFTDMGYAGAPIKVLQGANVDLVNKEYGAGPYTVIDRRKGESTILGKFDKFYDDSEGPAPRIGMRVITEMNARMAALEAGEIDWMDALTSEAANYLRRVKGIVVKDRKTLYVWFISLDMRKEPFTDVRVRRALNYALDKESLIKNVLGGAAQLARSPLSPQFGDFYCGDAVSRYDYDPARAKALLAEAGYPNGFKSTIYTNTGRAGQMKPVEMSQFIQANWKAVGVDCNIEALEWTAFERRRSDGEFPIATRGWTPSSGDPDGVLVQNFHSAMMPPVQRNVAFLKDPEVDRMLDAGTGTFDHATRVKAFTDAQKRIVDLAPWVFVCHEIAFEAHSDQLQAYNPHPSGFGEGLTLAWKK